MIFFLRTTLVIFLLNIPGLIGVTYAQGTDNYNVDMPSMPYLSPEAASLGKYGDIPVSEYTGVPQIEIPLHTVKSGNLELPITLSYHASGIKVQQEATWVGLGWDLMAGGCINRIISGANDEKYCCNVTPSEFDNLFAEVDEKSEFFITYAAINGQSLGGHIEFDDDFTGSPAHSTSLSNALVNGQCEPDIFQANFCGHSFSFYIHPVTKQIITVGKENGNYIVEMSDSASVIKSWKITDNNGVEYYFESNGTEQVPSMHENISYISSWYVTKIVHPINGVVNFSFSSLQRIYPTPSLFESYTDYKMLFPYCEGVLDGQGHEPYQPQIIISGVPIELRQKQENLSHTDGALETRYLTQISTEREQLEFYLSSRDDINGISESGKKLDSILVRNTMSNNRVTKRIIFHYSYFVSANSINECSLYTNEGSYSRRGMRLKLTSVSINDEVYNFDYNPLTLPNKTSYSQDFWGYYNGQNNTSLLCSANMRERINNPYNTIVMGDANRFVDEDCLQACMLAKITYPTKGNTEFIYESNSFVHPQEWFPSSDDISANTSAHSVNVTAQCYQNSTSGDKIKTFELSNNTLVSLHFKVKRAEWGIDISGGFAKLRKITSNGDTIVIRDFHVGNDWNTENPRYEIDVNDTILTSGKYEIQAGFTHIQYGWDTDDETHSELEVQWIDTTTIYHANFNGISYGGGLRIKEIRNHDELGNLIERTSYDYTNEDGQTSGILMLPVPTVKSDFLSIAEMRSEGGDFFHRLVLYETKNISSSVKVSPFTTINAVPVGYSRVTITKNDKKTISTFFNQPTNTLYNGYEGKRNPECALFTNLQNGCILEKKIYDNLENTLVQRQRWQYELLTDSLTTINAYARDLIYNPINYIPTKARYRYYVYPFLTQRIVSAQEITETLHNDSFIRDSVSYIYDNRYQPSLITKATEHAGVNETVLVKYPYDTSFANVAVYDSMLCRNMLSYPIETIKSVGGQTLSRSRNDYSLQSNLPLLTSRKWAQGSEQYRERIAMRYDCIGNCIEAMRNDGEPVTYLWSYRNTLPVARIEGMGYDDVVSLISSSVNTALINSVLPGDTILQSIRNSLSGHDVLVTTYTYDPLVGILSETAPNGETTTYEYDSIGRLIRVKDHRGKTINSYEYNYAH